MRNIYLVFLVVQLLILQSCYKETIIYNAEADSDFELPTILKINGKECCYDHTENSLRYPIDNDSIADFFPLIEFQDFSTVYFEGNELKNNEINNLGEIRLNKEYAIEVKTQDQTKQLSLIFTNLPIVQIITPNTIFDEPKTMAKIVVNYEAVNKPSDVFLIGIEYRGGTSQSYQKKSYGFSLKKGMGFNDDISYSFFDMKVMNKWILDAMWIDKSRMRNKISFDIWNGMDNQHQGISAKHIELYINNEHQGLYCFGENINAESLNLNNDDAVLYKATAWADGATRFEKYNEDPDLNYYWDGWEQKYPDPKVKINWEPLKQLRKLVVIEDDQTFTSQIDSLIDIDNFVDYYIFLNLVCAADNTGKNIFLVKTNALDKLYIIPWDIDGSWGLFWDGTYINYLSILTNNLFNRLLETNTNNFKAKVKQRWTALRANNFSEVELKNLFIENYNRINKTDIIDIENKKWYADIDMDTEQDYLMNWIENRVIFLDNYFNDL